MLAVCSSLRLYLPRPDLLHADDALRLLRRGVGPPHQPVVRCDQLPPVATAPHPDYSVAEIGLPRQRYRESQGTPTLTGVQPIDRLTIPNFQLLGASLCLTRTALRFPCFKHVQGPSRSSGTLLISNKPGWFGCLL